MHLIFTSGVGARKTSICHGDQLSVPDICRSVNLLLSFVVPCRMATRHRKLSEDDIHNGKISMTMVALACMGLLLVILDQADESKRASAATAARDPKRVFHKTTSSCQINLSQGWLVRGRLLNGSMVSGKLDTVPGYAHDALLANGVIGDPYYRFNEVDESWIAQANWTFHTEFDIPKGCAGSRIVFDYIDTAAVVWLNGRRGAVTASSFVPVWIDVETSGRTRLQVDIESALQHARRHVEEDSGIDVPYTHFYNDWADAGGGGPFEGKRGSARVYIRKPQSDFGWDWGPALVPAGLGGVRLEPHECQINALTLRPRAKNNGWVVVATPFVKDNNASDDCNLEVILESPEGELCERTVARHGEPVELTVPSPARLWWPNGFGQQPMYAATVTSRLDRMRKSVAIRQVDLDTSAAPTNSYNETGTHFRFVVNGRIIYVKGANVIPGSALSTDSNIDWEFVLWSAAAAHMNMVRVWGGGRYQSEEFFEIADRLGLLVWIEFAFACGQYPVELADLVSREIEHQARRLQSRAAVFGGNNENEQSLEWYDATLENRDLYVVDYATLFVDVVRSALVAVDSDVAYVDSSPSNGWLPDARHKRWGDPNAREHGDVHYYDYDADCQDFDAYPEARFISEHGIMSLPSMSAYARVTEAADLSLNSTFSKFRMRHQNGYEQLEAQLTKHLLPPDHATSFQDYVWATQLQQGLCYETALRAWRTLNDDPTIATAGVLYWQLNDVWPGPSWSTIDYPPTRWKVSHSVVARNMAPQLVFFDPRNLRLLCTNDDFTASVLHIRLELWTYAGRRISSYTFLKPVLLQPQSLRCLGVLALPLADNNLLIDTHSACNGRASAMEGPSNALIRIIVTGRADSYLFFSQLKDVELPVPPNVTVDVSLLSATEIRFVCSSPDIVAYLTLDLPNNPGVFSDNAFFLFPDEPKVVMFTPTAPNYDQDNDAYVRRLKADLALYSLNHLRQVDSGILNQGDNVLAAASAVENPDEATRGSAQFHLGDAASIHVRYRS